MAGKHRFRIVEPKDPILNELSRVIPDRWIDEQFPQRTSSAQGRWRGLRTSQFVRVHLLVVAKAIASFNAVCSQLRHNIDYRRFCRLAANDNAPTKRQLSDFRTAFGPWQWYQLHVYVLRTIAQLYEISPPGIVVFDACELKAAVSFCLKKSSGTNASNKSALPLAFEQSRAGRHLGSPVTRSTRPTGWCGWATRSGHRSLSAVWFARAT